MNKKEIQNLIATAKTREALTTLKLILPCQFHPEVNELLETYKQLKRKQLLGLISFANAQSKSTDLAIRALNLLQKSTKTLSILPHQNSDK